MCFRCVYCSNQYHWTEEHSQCLVLPSIRSDRTGDDKRSARCNHLHQDWKLFLLIIVNMLCLYCFENLHIIKQCETFVKRLGETKIRIKLHFWVRICFSELLLLILGATTWLFSSHFQYERERKRERERNSSAEKS